MLKEMNSEIVDIGARVQKLSKAVTITGWDAVYLGDYGTKYCYLFYKTAVLSNFAVQNAHGSYEWYADTSFTGLPNGADYFPVVSGGTNIGIVKPTLIQAGTNGTIGVRITSSQKGTYNVSLWIHVIVRTTTKLH